MKFKGHVGVYLSILILTLACSQKTLEAPVETEPEPISIGELGTHPLIFRSVSYRIPTGTVIGEVRVGSRVVDEMRWSLARSRALDFNVSVTDALRARGFNMRDSADALFDPAGDVKIRYVMAAILHAVELDFEYESGRRRRVQKGFGTADVDVEVQLYDAVAKETVYKRIFSGHGEDKGQKPNPIIDGIVDAILKVTTDADFVGLVSKQTGQPEVLASAVSKIEVAACDENGASTLPRDLPKALESVIEIQVGITKGTGVIVSPDGWIVTAAHVVDGAPEIWVRFASGAQVPATVEQMDTQFDVALLRVPGRDYSCSQIRITTEDLEIGSDVFAINLAIDDKSRPTVARGVVSGYPEEEGKRFIQTDASVNPGSSGGPLFAIDGKVAGIIVAKAFGIGIEGLGFAVPIRDVVRYLSVQLVDD